MARHEKSAGAVIFYLSDKPMYLLLKYPTYWGFAKGIIEEGEQIEDTVRREVEEETSLDNIKILQGFIQKQTWFYRLQGELINKEALYLLAQIDINDKDKVKISSEHENFSWCNLPEALEKMKLKANKEMLIKAEEFIKEKNKQKTLI